MSQLPPSNAGGGADGAPPPLGGGDVPLARPVAAPARPSVAPADALASKQEMFKQLNDYGIFNFSMLPFVLITAILTAIPKVTCSRMTA